MSQLLKAGEAIEKRNKCGFRSQVLVLRASSKLAVGRTTSENGKRKGTREARLPIKILWMRRMCVLRRKSIHKSKAEKAREKILSDQFEAKRAKNKASRERKFARREERLAQGPSVEKTTATTQPAEVSKKSKKSKIF